MSSSTKRFEELTTQEIADKSWKYIGYKHFSRFLASDNDFVMLRGFKTLHIRTLLALQDELSVLEAELNEFDTAVSSPSFPDAHNGTFRQDQLSERPVKLKQIKDKLIEYDDFVTRTSHIFSQSHARIRDIASVTNWLYNNYHPIQEAEVEYLSQDDLIPLIPKARSFLRKLLEKSTRFRLSRLWRDGTIRDPEVECDRTRLVYTSDERIERSLSVVILLLGMIMLISPLWILHTVKDPTEQLAVITLYIITFTILLSFTTTARTFENLAATAAYSAVLMVFFS